MDTMAKLLNSPEGKSLMEEIQHNKAKGQGEAKNTITKYRHESSNDYDNDDDNDTNGGNTNGGNTNGGNTNGGNINDAYFHGNGAEGDELDDANGGNTNNGSHTFTLDDESNTSGIVEEIFNSAISQLQKSTKIAATKSSDESELSADNQQHHHLFRQEPIEFARNVDIFTAYSVRPPIQIDFVAKIERDSKKRKIHQESRYKSKAIVKRIDNTLGAPRPFPRGTLDEKGWRVFFTLLKKFESQGNIDCKRLWTYKRYDEVYQIIHCILMNMMLQKTKNKQYLDETEIFNMRNVFGIWYRSTFKEKGPFHKIVKGIRKGKGWMFSDEEVNALDVGMYMYPADTTQNRFYCIRHDCLCGPVFQDTRTPFQLYDKARSLNVERPWEQLCRFYELQENLTKETMAAFEERKNGKQS
jgi:hypothetical protein